VPRLIAVVVLPTPPFWFAIASTRGGVGCGDGVGCGSGAVCGDDVGCGSGAVCGGGVDSGCGSGPVCGGGGDSGGGGGVGCGVGVGCCSGAVGSSSTSSATAADEFERSVIALAQLQGPTPGR
jgi:hypothetical protein